MGPQVSLVEVWPVSSSGEGKRPSASINNGAQRGSKANQTHSTQAQHVIAQLHFATMGSDVPQFLTAVADAVENISVPVLALGTFVLCIFLHFIVGLLSKLSGSKKKRKKGVAKKVN